MAAAVTTRIGLGTGILLAAQHDPILLAKQVGTLDHLSAGRVTLGVGYRLEQGRSGAPRRRLRPPLVRRARAPGRYARPSDRPSRPSSTASSSTSVRRGPGRNPCSSRGCAHSSAGRPGTRSSRRWSRTQMAGFPSAAGVSARPSRGSRPGPSRPAATPPPSRRPLRHPRGPGKAGALRPPRRRRGRATGAGGRRVRRPGRARHPGPAGPVRCHTGAVMTDLIDDTTPRLG